MALSRRVWGFFCWGHLFSNNKSSQAFRSWERRMQAGWKLSPPSITPLCKGARPGSRGPWCQSEAQVTAPPCEESVIITYSQWTVSIAGLHHVGVGFDTHANFCLFAFNHLRPTIFFVKLEYFLWDIRGVLMTSPLPTVLGAVPQNNTAL